MYITDCSKMRSNELDFLYSQSLLLLKKGSSHNYRHVGLEEKERGRVNEAHYDIIVLFS